MVVLVMVSTVLCSNGCWANPFTVVLDAPLEDNIDHLISANWVSFDLYASGLPSLEHLVLAFPLTLDHHTVVWLLIKVLDVLDAEINSLMSSAHVSKCHVLSVHLSANNLSVIEMNWLSLEERVEFLSTDMSAMDNVASSLKHVVHVFLADELEASLDTARVLECQVHGMLWANQFTRQGTIVASMRELVLVWGCCLMGRGHNVWLMVSLSVSMTSTYWV